MFKEACIFTACCVAFLAVVFGTIAALANWGEEVQCRNTAAAMGVPYQYSFTTPCLIKPEGKPWVPLKSYRVI